MAHLRVETNRLRKGMTIKNNVYSRSGAVLVPENTPVTKDIVSLLSRHFINYVIVEYDAEIPIPSLQGDPVPGEPHTINEKKLEEFKQSFETVENTLAQSLMDIISNDTEIDVNTLLNMLNSIVEKSESNINLCDMLLQMKKTSEGLYAHSINVALFSQILAKWMDFEKQDIEMVMISALLHDIGILKIPGIDMQTFSFKDELEGGRYEKHVIYGYNIIKDKNLDNRIKQAILTHHERMDGHGFPLQVSISNINRLSRCIAVADIYDTLTMKEKNRASMSAFDVLKELEDHGHHKLDPQMLMTFISKISNNFVQHSVLLSTGERAQIVLINKYNLSRPLVQVGSAFVDLANRNDISIKELLD